MDFKTDKTCAKELFDLFKEFKGEAQDLYSFFNILDESLQKAQLEKKIIKNQLVKLYIEQDLFDFKLDLSNEKPNLEEKKIEYLRASEKEKYFETLKEKMHIALDITQDELDNLHMSLKQIPPKDLKDLDNVIFIREEEIPF